MLYLKKYGKLPSHLIKFYLLNKQINSNFIRSRSRSFMLLPKFIDSTVELYNGKQYFSFIVKEKMIGHKAGEFAFTKRMGHQIHRNIIEKNKQKRKLLKKSKVPFKK
jgi:small subunit ribosomal protein S19